MKKQKMINELRDLRKEYKLQEESKDLMGGYNTFANTRNFSDQ